MTKRHEPDCESLQPGVNMPRLCTCAALVRDAELRRLRATVSDLLAERSSLEGDVSLADDALHRLREENERLTHDLHESRLNPMQDDIDELTRLREEKVQMLAASAERVQMDGAEIARLRRIEKAAREHAEGGYSCNDPALRQAGVDVGVHALGEARERHLSIGRGDLEYLARELVGAVLDALAALADALEETPR
jgi:hypothetical protein